MYEGIVVFHLIFETVPTPINVFKSYMQVLSENMYRGESKIKVLLHGSVCDEQRWRLRTNGELAGLLGRSEIVAKIPRARLRWSG